MLLFNQEADAVDRGWEEGLLLRDLHAPLCSSVPHLLKSLVLSDIIYCER